MGFICLLFVKIWTNMQEKQTSVCICTLFTTWGCICSFSIIFQIRVSNLTIYNKSSVEMHNARDIRNIRVP